MRIKFALLVLSLFRTSRVDDPLKGRFDIVFLLTSEDRQTSSFFSGERIYTNNHVTSHHFVVFDMSNHLDRLGDMNFIVVIGQRKGYCTERSFCKNEVD
jgi:hypothetical protein